MENGKGDSNDGANDTVNEKNNEKRKKDEPISKQNVHQLKAVNVLCHLWMVYRIKKIYLY